MKKPLLVLCSILFAMSASAVSVNWGGNKSGSKFTGLTSGAALTGGAGSETASISVYYILYSNFDTLKDKGNTLDKASFEGLNLHVATAAGNATSAGAAGRIGTSSTTTAYETSGISYFARAYATIGGEDYFMDLFGGGGNGGVWTTSQSGDITLTETLGWENGTYGGSVADAVGTKNAWVKIATTDPVPEPATGALALAGIALLFRRRRA